LTATEQDEVCFALTAWLTESPVTSPKDRFRLQATRRGWRQLCWALGQEPAELTRHALGLGGQKLTAAPEWKREKLALMADACLVSPAELDAWAALAPEQAIRHAVAALDDEALERARAQALDDIAVWLAAQSPLALPLDALPLLQQSSFFASYLCGPARHGARRTIAGCAAASLAALGTAASPAWGAGPRPRLTVVAEMLFPRHAMYRCYAEGIASLRRHFHVTLWADEFTRCVEHAELADECRYFDPRGHDVTELARSLLGTRPEVLVYPSVGMTLWTFTLSQLRLAPLQLASVGHPAASFSDAIDGVLMYEDLRPAAEEGFGRRLAHDLQALPAPPVATARAARPDGAAIIGVNAAVMKLNSRMIDALRNIVAGAPAGTQLRMFPNLRGGELAAWRTRVRRLLPDAEVLGAMPYEDYMRSLGECSLLLQSFPFGGTNTAIDAFALGVPMVCLRGTDLAAQVDALLLEGAGLGQLCADSAEAYVDLALQLLRHESPRELLQPVLAEASARLSMRARAGRVSFGDAAWQAWQDRLSR
jgi:hypothetical protein